LLALPPARRFAILTCMDARLDPAKYAGLNEGDAHVIRKAGGRASDDVMSGLLANSLETAALGQDGFTDVGTGPGSTEGTYVDWLTISDNAQSVAEDVQRIRSHPLAPDRIPIYGYLYDVRSGRLNEVPDATKAGQPA